MHGHYKDVDINPETGELVEVEWFEPLDDLLEWEEQQVFLDGDYDYGDDY